ncbi:MAG: NAD(P)H-hydrate dehydratase, partial [Pirellulales bacterium]
GHGTVVTDGAQVYVNHTGNPGMATGGSGDVLTGIITALLCQGMSPFPAAQLGVYLHGLAGDKAKKYVGMVSLTASDLVDHLPAAFAEHE